MCLKGLKALYKDEIPQRGDIFVSFKEGNEEGVTGVIANVITNITGATEKFGFDGIKGNFSRRNLMEFNADINVSVKFKRLDTNKSVEVYYDPSLIESNPKLMILMQKILSKQASLEEKQEFGEMWQERVERIFNNIDKVIIVK
jgi:hypothetical protein